LNGQKPREIAGRVLQQRSGSAYTETLLDRALAESRLSPRDRALCQELVYGVARWQATLDWLIARKSQGRTQKPGLQNLLRLGLYQIFWLDRIPNHAAVNETVEQARRNGFGHQAGFVNAVLRGYLREFDATKELLAGLKTSQPDIGYSHPAWLVHRPRERWGAENAACLLEWNNTPPKVFARVNSLAFIAHTAPAIKPSGKTTPRPFIDREFEDAGDVLAQWRDEGVEYDFVRKSWIDEGLVFELKSTPPIARLPSFRYGLFYVQDPSTLLAVSELDPQPGETILDLCAAPGGKATFIAQCMENRGRVVAHDVSPDRIQLLRENCDRLRAACVEITSDVPPTQFDRVLVDAPCSNTGVLRRRVDLRWRIQQEELARLQSVQLELLTKAASVLKPEGVLIYSTCSLEPEENMGVIELFLKANPAFTLEHHRELLPFADGVDGAFVARLVRS